uniref:allantoinase n=1 Tax=mine drainage metagenome TaxID=410659 RepID=E6QLB5_9ZZZZ
MTLANQKPVWAFRSTRVVTPQGVRPAAVLIQSGRILKLNDWSVIPPKAQLRDYGEHVILPGLVDTHVHINDAGEHISGSRSHWEGFATATRAAASGGVTTLVDMPLNCVPETITARALEAKRAAAKPHAAVDWMSWGGIVGNGDCGGNEADIPDLIRAGVSGFKSFLIDSGIATFAWTDRPQLERALAALEDKGLPLLVHAELAAPIERAARALEAADWPKHSTWLASRPDAAELDALEMLLALAPRFRVPIHIVHVSSALLLPLIEQAREAGLSITAETCPHYLHFAAEEIPDGATLFKCAPPIRGAANREALWRGLKDGVLDFVATDHSPCPPESKHLATGRFDHAWGGIASLGLALPILWTGLESRDGSLEQLVRWLATAPARLAGLEKKKGSLRPGADADIVVFDPDVKWTVAERDLHFQHKFSPYLGAQLKGKVLETYLRGECIYWARGLDPVFDSRANGKELRPRR